VGIFYNTKQVRPTSVIMRGLGLITSLLTKQQMEKKKLKTELALELK
jgi:hypothetical protein